MGHEDPHHDSESLDDAIDSLLSDEFDADAEGSAQPNDPAEGNADPDDAPENLDASSDPNELGNAALEAIDSVEQNAQSLIEDAIDDLIDQDEDASEPSIESLSELDEETDGTMSLEELSAQLDALDEGEELEPNLVSELDEIEEIDEPEEINEINEIEEVPEVAEQGSESEPADELSEETKTPDDKPSDETEADALSDDDLLSSIADDLIDYDSPQLSAVIENVEDLQDLEDAVVGETDNEPDSEESNATDILEHELLTAAVDAIEESPEIEDENAESQPGIDVDDVSATAQTGPSNDADLEEASTLADLDASLAGIGDDLLSGDFETPDGDLLSSDSIGGADASALLEQLHLGDLGLGETEQAETEQTPTSTDTPQEDTTHAPVSPAPAEPATKPAISKTNSSTSTQETHAAPFQTADEQQGDIPEVQSIWQSAHQLVLRITRTALTQTKTHGVPLAAKLVLVVNRPVEDRPAKIRDTIGYLAMWTMLLAVVLWVYIAFVRETPTPPPTQAPSRMLEPGEVVDPLRNPGAEP